MTHHTKHLLLLPLILLTPTPVQPQPSCQEDPSSLIAARVASGRGNTIFTSCGVLANNPQFIPAICSLDPRSAAEPFSPASLCQQTCQTDDDPEDPSSEILILKQSNDGSPRLIDAATCGDLASAGQNIIASVCDDSDLAIWDDYRASDVCCQTCDSSDSAPPSPAPLPQCTDWNLIGEDIDGTNASDYMGEAVSLSADGKTVAVSATGYDGDAGTNIGLVRVLKYDEDGMEWVQSGGDITGLAASDSFGTSVSLSSDGTVLAVGAYWADPGGGISNGQVRVFLQNDTTEEWEPTGEFNGDVDFANLGEAVDLSSDGNTIAMGAPGAANYAGHVRVYSRNDVAASSWLPKGNPITGEASSDASGSALALSSDGNIVAIGAYRNAAVGFRAGHVRVYEYNDGTGGWVKIGNDIDAEASEDESGSSVALSADGTVVAIGAPSNEGNGYRAGHVRVYRRGLDDDLWEKIGQDVDGEFTNDFCGSAVALSADGGVLAVGAEINDGETGVNSGHVRMYGYDEGGDVWEQIGEDVDGEAGADWLGASVDISADGRVVASGAVFNDGNGSSAGHVRVFGC